MALLNPAGRAGAAAHSEMIRVLLVEANPADARLLQEALADTATIRTELVLVSRAADALGLLNQRHFDVALLDLALPDSRGLETLTRLRTHHSDMPLIILTSLNDEALAIEAVQQGAQDYLIKGELTGAALARSIRYAIERQRINAALEGLSLTDELTGLYNRRGFMTLMQQPLRLARRLNRNLLLMVADLDGLKEINDTFGHREGDWALIKSAEILKTTFRDSDIVARVGGDEFAVLAVGAADDSGEVLTRRLERNLKLYGRQRQRGYELSFSIGITQLQPGEPFSFEELMSQADTALYEQKRRKRENKRSTGNWNA